MPAFKTLVVADPEGQLAGIELDRKTFRIRKRVEHEVGIYFASLSARTITYKGMLTTMQLKPFFLDLSDERMKAKIAIVHSRFSTNTFPSWPLAQPFRQLAHNGEINTIQGNRNWLSAREGRLSSELLGEFAAAADRDPGLLRFRHVRRMPRTAAPVRTFHAARHLHDAAAGMGEERPA